jgi:hypothetical protein
MSSEFLGERRQAMEESFFHMHNQKLLDEFRRHLAHLDRRAQLADATGIHDEAVLDRLITLNVGPETLAALTLVPLVEVAWADGKPRGSERRAVLSAAESAGIRPDDDAHQLLEQWLTEKPDREMLDTWKEYVRALCRKLDPEAVEALKHDLLDRAYPVAQAAGGVLGLGSVSKAERAMLNELQAAFA